MALRDQPHDLGEMVDDVLPSSQAFEAGIRKGWIIVEINGKRFSKSERLQDIAKDFDSAKAKSATLEVKFDVRTFLDCTNADCKNSGQFPTNSLQRCAEACGQVIGCQWWAFGSNDDDTMCNLYSDTSGFVRSDSITSGPQTCVPVPVMSNESGWPSCVTLDADLHNGKPLFADVRDYVQRDDEVRHRDIIFSSTGNIGMVLRETPHDLGEIVSGVQPGSQGEAMGVREGWIIKEVDGRPFNRSETLLDVGADFSRAKTLGSALTVKFDVKTSMDCTNGDCKKSDKFSTTTQDQCAYACSQIAQCASWSFAVEEEDPMCWLRSDVPSVLRAHEGSMVGNNSCYPSRVGANFTMVAIVAVLAYAVYQYGSMVKGIATLPVLRRLFLKDPGLFNDKAFEMGGIDNGPDELESLMGQGAGNTNKRVGSNAGSTWQSASRSISSWGGKLASTFGTRTDGGHVDLNDFLEDDDI